MTSRRPSALPQRRLSSKPVALDDYTRRLIQAVCDLAGDRGLLADHAQTRHLKRAIASNDTPALYDWLVVILSYQGISDRAAEAYMERHGTATWATVEQSLTAVPNCPKLTSFWHFEGCRYDKGKQTCARPQCFANCPLPKLKLRNGRLNQTAYSLYLYLRDVAGSDLVGLLRDHTLVQDQSATTSGQAGGALIDLLRGVYGVSDKTLAMALSTLLLAAPRKLARWRAVGASLIVVDTLVHNFFVRTGVLRRANAKHGYGAACYSKRGCASIIRAAAQGIKADHFSRSYPTRFARFVQHALWRYCAEGGLNICNGNKIAAKRRCANQGCRLYSGCDRRPAENS